MSRFRFIEICCAVLCCACDAISVALGVLSKKNSMDDEFARALDVLHNRIDGAIETIRPVGTTLKEAPAPVTVIAPILPAEKEKQATSFLVTLFLLGLLLIGL